MPRAFLIQAMRTDLEPIRHAIEEVVRRMGLVLVTADSAMSSGPILDTIYQEIETADLVIADLTEATPNVMYDLGFAHGAQRPVVFVSADLQGIPFDIRSVQAILFSRELEDLPRFRVDLTHILGLALGDPSQFTHRPKTRQDVNRVFISYSHRDRSVLDRLLVHLKPLERDGLIDAWSDIRIEAGSDWKREVEAALQRARAAILLVTADFLASDFIVNDELPQLLDGAASAGTFIVPLIVKPCRYTRDSKLRRLQAINDPRQPLAGLPEVEQERVLDSVAEAVEVAMRPLQQKN